jgi:hypothetical protein
MAQRTRTILVDDIEGTEITDGGQTITFAYRGAQYQIDLNEENAAKFDEAMAFYIQHASRVGGRRQSGSGGNGKGRDKPDLNAIRQWARENGHQVSSRGRIPQAVQDAYAAAH